MTVVASEAFIPCILYVSIELRQSIGRENVYLMGCERCFCLPPLLYKYKKLLLPIINQLYEIFYLLTYSAALS